ncbi:glyoxalase [Streptomyces sp. NPDC051561]|uniref:glyoxalase n=1 Tax=Streptomyces sp. NPDC051561 TaxID=3365658 RepID=UPI00378D9779
MNLIDAVIIEATDTAAAESFYATAFGLDSQQIRVRAAQAPSTGFRGFSLALTVAQPADVDSLFASAVEAGATVLKPAVKGLWGYGGVLRAPEGTIWKIATSAKKNTGPATRHIDEMVLLIGVADVAATKKFYVERGLTVGKSFGSRYVDFEGAPGHLKLALYRHKALAKEVGVSPEGSGSHRIVLAMGDEGFSDLDGFVWEAAATASAE